MNYSFPRINNNKYAGCAILHQIQKGGNVISQQVVFAPRAARSRGAPCLLLTEKNECKHVLIQQVIVCKASCCNNYQTNPK